MDGILAIANGSASSLYGCIGCALNDLIVSKFPNNYFKYTTISSELASRNIRRQFGTNTNIEMRKREKPYLIVQPTYSAADPDGPMQNIPLTRNLDDLQYRTDKRYLFEVLKDKKYGYNLKFKMNRAKIDYDITVATDTLHQQLDIHSMIQNQIIWDRSYSFRIALESVIPKNIIGIMSKCAGMDIERFPEYIPVFLQRLNSISGYPITYKMRNASATDEWFMYYTHNVIVTFTDLEIESGQRKNMVEDYFPVRFRVTAEFNLPGVYMVDGELNNFKNVDLTLITKDYQGNIDSYYPLYTITNLFNRYPPEQDGMQLYGTTIFTEEGIKPAQVEDRIELGSLFDASHSRVIRAHSAWKMNPETLMKIYLLKNNEQLTLGIDYCIDYNRLELVLFKPDATSTYRIITYFNYNTVNEILNNSEYENNYDVDKIKENDISGAEVIDNLVFDNGADNEFCQVAPTTYLDGHVPEEKVDDPETHIIKRDPVTTSPIPSVIIDGIEYPTDTVISTQPQTIEPPTENTESEIKTDSKAHAYSSSVITNDMTTADIANIPVVKKKRFSSSTE